MRKMRRSFSSLFIWVFILVLTTEVWAGQASKTYTFSAGDTIIAEEFNSNFDNVYNAYNAHDTAVTAVHQMGTAVIMGTTLTQTSSNKTEVSPIITTSPTAAGATWGDLGTVTSSTHTWIKINSGDASGATWSDLGTVTTSTHTWIKVNSGTFVSPVITTSPTAVGATWADLGTVTSSTHTWVDINGGTIDGTTIGAASPSTAVVTTLDTGQGANELYDMDQNVQTTDPVVFTTVDTGQGANELYDMDQNVQTTDDVTFSSTTVTNTLTVKTVTLSAATTRYYSVGAEGGGMRMHAQEFLLTTLGTVYTVLQSNSDTAPATVFYPVLLPHNAIVTSFKVYWFRDDAAATGSATLNHHLLSNDGFQNMANANSNSSGGAHSVEDTTISNATIDNSACRYSFHITVDPNDAKADVYFFSAVITYTVLSPLP